MGAEALAFVVPTLSTRWRYIHYNSRMAMMTINGETTTSSSSTLADPYSEQAKQDLNTFYTHHNLPLDNIDAVHKSLLRLTECVISWNEKINLVSRKECTPIDVYHKHVMPSVALLPLLLMSSSISEQQQQQQHSTIQKHTTPLRVVDIGTGGGFPGLPLALLLPQHQFTLVDSIRKKLVAVSDMASELNLSNVRIHCGRAEEMMKLEGRAGMYCHDVVLGRSVTALPNFCSWIHDLLKREEGGNRNVNNYNDNRDFDDKKIKVVTSKTGGRLIYIIGGEIDDMVQSKIVSDIPIDTLLQRPMNTSDKRALVFTARGVREIAKEFMGAKRQEENEKMIMGTRRNNYGSNINNRKKLVGGRGGVDKRGGEGERRRAGTGRNNKPARGAWSEKRNDGVAKQRGYDDFQRYES